MTGRCRIAVDQDLAGPFRSVNARPSSTEPKGWVLIGDQKERVPGDPVYPAKYADDEPEEALRVLAGEEDGEPGKDDRDHDADPEEKEHEVMRDGEEPLDKRQPAVQPAGVRIREVEMDRLLLVGRWVAVVE